MNSALVCSIPKREHFFQLHFQMFSLHLGRIISTNHAKKQKHHQDDLSPKDSIQFQRTPLHYIPSWPHEKVTAQWETYFIWTLKCKYIVFVLKSLANSSGLAWHYGPLWCNFNLTSSLLYTCQIAGGNAVAVIECHCRLPAANAQTAKRQMAIH